MSSVSSAAAKAATGFGFTDSLPQNFVDYQAEIQASMKAIATPLNIAVLIVIVTIIYYRINKSDAVPNLPGIQPITFRTFTPRTLRPFDGHPSKPYNPDGKVYLAVKGKVYDVSSGRNFYGPGAMYENFAGHDATRGLACQSFDEDMLTKDLDGPLDDLKDLKPDELENLNGWIERFEEKYLVVGKLVAFNRNTEF